MISSRLITPNPSLLECGGIQPAPGRRKEGVRGGEAALAGVICLIKQKWEREFLNCLNFVLHVLVEQSGAGNTD